MSSSPTVMVLTPVTGGFYFGEMIAGMTREVAAAGGRVVVVQTLDAGETATAVNPQSYTSAVAWERADGVVSIGAAVNRAYLEGLRLAAKPIALASPEIEGFEAPSAVPDNRTGTLAAVEHLAEHGHRRIGFIGRLAHVDILERRAAYLEALDALGIAPEPAYLFAVSDNGEAGGAEAAGEFLSLAEPPTAVLAATDGNALGFVEVITQAGLRVPEDVAVIGFDDTEAGVFGSPPLTSVNQRFDEVGAAAGRLLLDQLDVGPAPGVPCPGRAPAEHRRGEPSPALLVRRSSCGCFAGHPLAEADGPEDAASLRALLFASLDSGAMTATRSGTFVETTVQSLTQIADAAEAVLAGAPEIGLDLLRSAMSPLADARARQDLLPRVVLTVNHYLARLADTCGPGGTREHQVLAGESARMSTLVTHLQARAHFRRTASLDSTLDEQYRVGRGLLDHSHAEPRSLSWLSGTHVRAGVLALWDGDDLVVQGLYDPDRTMSVPLGERMAVDTFPPAELVHAADPSRQEVTYVIPVRARGNDWGMLAIIGEVDTTSGRETYNHWADLLCSAFEQQELAESVRSSEARFAQLARAMNDGLWEWDLLSGEVEFSPRCLEILGIEPGQMWFENVALWRAGIHPDDIDPILELARTAVDAPPDMREFEYRHRMPDGRHRWLLARVVPTLATDGTRNERLVGTLADIDHRKQLEEQLRQNALFDAATGMPNRRQFLDRLQRAVDRWRDAQIPFAVLFLDLDRFKVVNDSLGHHVGDLLLKAVGDRIHSQLRGNDIAARFGGDEFAVLLQGIDPADVPAVARRIQDSMAEPLVIEGHALWVGASVGIASSSADYATPEDVLRDADTAMYHAKARERGTLSVFDRAMHHDAVQHLTLENEIQRALDDEQFEVHYQPIVDLEHGRADRFEALVRWRHPERGLVLPGEFLPLMEETGLVIRLGRWVLAEVCRQIAEWRTTYAGDVNVSVNISDREFWHSGLMQHLADCLDEHGLTAGHLTLEVTEGVIMRRPDVAHRLMEQMHEVGVRLHIDDFGAGHSSLQTLHRFPVEALKIDRSFVAGLATAEQSRELVRAIVAMGRALGLEVIAEGVETAAQRDVLQEMGCASAQGFLFDRAVDGGAAGRMLGVSLHPVTV